MVCVTTINFFSLVLLFQFFLWLPLLANIIPTRVQFLPTGYLSQKRCWLLLRLLACAACFFVGAVDQPSFDCWIYVLSSRCESPMLLPFGRVGFIEICSLFFAPNVYRITDVPALKFLLLYLSLPRLTCILCCTQHSHCKIKARILYGPCAQLARLECLLRPWSKTRVMFHASFFK